MKPKSDKPGAYSWSWVIECGKTRSGKVKWGLCCWSEPTKERLIARGKPSTEARPVRVHMKTTAKL